MRLAEDARATAADGDSVAFLVMMSPSAFTPAEQEIQSLQARMRNSDFPEADVAEAVAYTRLYFYVAATGRGWDGLEAETARLPEAAAEGRWRFPRVSPLVLSELEAWISDRLGVSGPGTPARR